MSLIYHITSRQAAQAARQSGEYRAESLDTQGFIHFSQAHQLLGVANSFYAGQNDLAILVVDTTLLKSELKYEAPDHPIASSGFPLPAADQRFPHLYGPLNFDAVLKVVDLPPLPDGFFDLPAL